MLRKTCLISLVLICITSLAFGSGFSIYEHGAKGTAMGGAFIAQANDPTAIFYNPAGITALKGTQFGLGVTVIMPQFDFTGPSPSTTKTDAEKLTFFPPHLYITHQFNEQWSAGFGFYSLFGLASEWPENWVGRELNTNTELTTMFFNPVVAFKPVESLSIAVGASLVYSNVVMQYDVLALPAGTPGLAENVYVGAKLDGTTTAFGFNAGVQFKATEQLTLGLHYRHNVKLKIDDGEATFAIPATGIPAYDAALAGNFPTPNTGKAEIELPNLIGIGIAYDFTEQLTAEFDWMQLGWSSYDVLTLEFDKPVGGEKTVSDDKKYEDSYSLRVGLEYRINEAWAIRGGYLRDNRAVPDAYVEPTLPEGDRHLFSLGFGWKMDNFSVDGYFMLLTQDDRTITNSTKFYDATETAPQLAKPFNGTYTGGANLFGVTLGYAL
jgi:long-chain fatty acid transport protein